MASKTINMPRSTTQTDIAVLQVQFKNIEQDIGDIKSSIDSIHGHLERNAEETRTMLKEMREDDVAAHKELGDKISALEKWKLMVAGGAVVLSYLGFDSIVKLLK